MDDLDVSRLATCARNDDDVAELSEVIPLLFQRRNDGNDEQNDQAEEEFDHSGNDARTGDAEDQCNKTDDHNNQPASEQDEVDPSLLKFPAIAGNNSTNYHNNQPTSEQDEVDPSLLKFPPIAGNKSTNDHNNQPTSEQDEVDLALLKLPPIAGNKSTTSKRSAESTVGGTRKRHKSTSALAAPKRRAAKATSSTATTTAASTPKRHAAKAKSSSAATNAASTPKRRAAKATSFTAASTAASTTDELIGKLVGFYLDSPMGQSLKVSFGKKWSDQAVCFLLNEEHGHLVGTVMRAVGQSSKKKSQYLRSSTRLLGNSQRWDRVQLTLDMSLVQFLLVLSWSLSDNPVNGIIPILGGVRVVPRQEEESSCCTERCPCSTLTIPMMTWLALLQLVMRTALMIQS